MSCTGLHQGDNLATHLHSISSFPIVSKIDEEVPDLKVNAWIQDDGTCVGNISSLTKVVEILRTDGPELGLHLSDGDNKE